MNLQGKSAAWMFRLGYPKWALMARNGKEEREWKHKPGLVSRAMLPARPRLSGVRLDADV